eukprot:11972257-Alexandrium_andersonii.AAC.1
MLGVHRRTGARGSDTPEQCDQVGPVTGPVALLLRSAVAAVLLVDDHLRLRRRRGAVRYCWCACAGAEALE